PDAAESGRDPGGRDAGRRDDRDGADGCGDRPPGALDAAYERRDPGDVAYPRQLSGGQSAADPAAAFPGAGGGHRAAVGAGDRRGDALAGDGDHDRDGRGAVADPEGRRSSASVADLDTEGGGDDDDGAEFDGAGEGGEDRAGY